MSINRYVPLLSRLENYHRDDFRGDLLAGLTVGVMLIPQGMAYAMIAGLPPIYGLYTALVPMLIYSVFGTCSGLSIGPTAMVAILVSAGLTDLATPGSPEWIQLAILLSLGAGLLQFLLGLFRLGFLVNFLSHPVVSGFTSAAAILIILSQVKHLLGIDLSRAQHIQDIIRNLLPQLQNTHVPTAILGTLSILLIIGIKKFKPSWPAALIVVILITSIAHLLHFDQWGILAVGEIPRGLPNAQAHWTDWETWKSLIGPISAIALIGYVESMAVSKTILRKPGPGAPRVDSNQELYAMGLANMAGSFFQAMPVAGSFSRSIVNEQSGARTTLSSLFAALFIALILLFASAFFVVLPKAILAAIIMVAVSSLFHWKEAVELWKTDRRDLSMMLLTFVITLIAGVETGILSGVILSLALVIYSSSRPHYAILGRLPKSRVYKNIERFPQAEEQDGILIMRPDARLYFANLEFIQEAIEKELKRRRDVELLIMDCTSVNTMDSSAVHMLKSLIRDLGSQGISLRMLGIIGPVRDILEKNGLDAVVGKNHIYTRIQNVVDQYYSEKNASFELTNPSKQRSEA
jgi:SulP family sulfate permease